VGIKTLHFLGLAGILARSEHRRIAQNRTVIKVVLRQTSRGFELSFRFEDTLAQILYRKNCLRLAPQQDPHTTLEGLLNAAKLIFNQR
jgi:hypothetical protein